MDTPHLLDFGTLFIHPGNQGHEEKLSFIRCENFVLSSIECKIICKCPFKDLSIMTKG